MTAEQAIERAEAIARARGWPWLPPVRADRRRVLGFGPTRWHVRSNAEQIGANVRVVLDDATGAVLSQGFAPR